MKNKYLSLLCFIFLFISCNNADKNAPKKKLSDSVNMGNKNIFTATINNRKTEDHAPLIILKKQNNNANESISMSGVFNDANSHIGLLIVKDSGNLSAGKYLLQQNEKQTNGRYETNINGGTTPIENTLYKATGLVNIIRIDTIAKKIVADVDMDAVNKIQQKVHITAHISSGYK